MTSDGASDDPAGAARRASAGDSSSDDPVRARRARIARWSLLANRVGYLLFAVAVALFVIAFVVGFTGPLVAVIIAAMVVGSLLLAPSIVLGYAVKAAEAEDRARGR